MNRLQLPANWTGIRDGLITLTWIAFLVALPVTSFPFFPPELGGRTLVRPLGAYPLIVLLILATLPRLFTRPLPKNFLPLFAFACAASISSLLAIASGVQDTLGVSVTARTVRTMATLGLGGAIYLTAVLLPRSLSELRGALKWIYAGFGVALLWGSVQAVYVLRFNPDYFGSVNKIQGFISIRRLFTKRISGMTYEPNWFAEQIVLLLLPWLLAAVISGYSLFRWRWRGLTIELGLLAWSIAVLIFTFSRAGLALLVLLIIASALLYLLKQPKRAPTESSSRLLDKPLARIGLALLIVAIILGAAFSFGLQNNYFSRIWRYWIDRPPNRTFFEYIAFDQRFVYWETGLRMYTLNPFFGVGLGNYTYYFAEMLPEQPWFNQPEILSLITPRGGNVSLITPKNLYVRLLSETGLVGLAIFLAFGFGVLAHALSLYLSEDEERRFWGRGAVLGMIAVAIGALSFDSFALPNLWVVFGLITASAWVLGSPQTVESTFAGE